MAKNQENINKVRVANGLEPLEVLPGAKENGDPGAPTDPPKKTGDEPEKTDEKPPAGDPPNLPLDADIDDERILQILKKKGINANSLEELLPKADPTVAAEKREVDKLGYGLTKGLFSLKDHENYVREKDNPRDLVFAQFFEEAKSDDPDLTNEEIQAEFEEKYGMGAEPTSRKYKRGAQEIGLLADKILKERYKAIFQADDAFTKHETSENDKNTRNRTILAKAPIYKADIETVFQGLKKVTVPVSETESYEIEVPEEDLLAVKNLFLDPENCAKQILAGYTPDSIKEVAYTTLLRQNIAKISLDVAKQYHLKRQAGSKGIPPVGPQRRTEGRVLSENQRKVLAEHGVSEEDLPPVNAN